MLVVKIKEFEGSHRPLIMWELHVVDGKLVALFSIDLIGDMVQPPNFFSLLLYIFFGQRKR